MEKSMKLRIRYWSRQPKALLMITGCVAVVLNAIFFAWQTLPGYLHRSQAQTELITAQQQWKDLSLKPDPGKVSDEAIAKLLTEVPTNIEASKVLSTLLHFSADTEVWISFFKQTDAAKGTDQMQLQINALSGSQVAGTGTEPSADLSSTVSPTAISESQAGTFRPESYELTINGKLSNLFNYFDLLASNTTITNIDTWTLAEILESDAQKITELSDKKGNYTMTVTFSMYSIPEYAPVFGSDRQEHPPINEMLKQLQTRYPGVKSFGSMSSGESKK